MKIPAAKMLGNLVGAVNEIVTAAAIRDRLATLTGTNRLDITAIKNLTAAAIAAITKTASDNLRNSNDAENSRSSMSYETAKLFYFPYGFLGTARIKFDFRTSSGVGETGYARLTKNGNVVGLDYDTMFTSYVTISQDIDLGVILPGEYISLELYNDQGDYTWTRNLRLYYDDAPTVAVQATAG
jgi:hypothetical protein